MLARLAVVLALAFSAPTAPHRGLPERAAAAEPQKGGAESADALRILFIDVGGSDESGRLSEGELLARALRYKLEWDFLYRDDPKMSRLYPALDLDRALGAEVRTEERTRRARGVELFTGLLTGEKELAQLLAKKRPHVVHLLAHGSAKAGFEAASWADHKGQEFPLTKVAKALAAAKLDLAATCLVTPACDFGNEGVLEGLRSMGFGCVIAWPGSVCASEALEFDGDLYEALVAQYVLHRGSDPFWDFAGGCPPALRRAFDFAEASLEARYRVLDEHFRDSLGAGVAGYYLHTKSWAGEPYGYAALPVMRCR